MNRKILELYFKRQLPPNEREVAEAWLLDSRNKEEAMHLLEQIYMESTHEAAPPNIEKVWANIRAKQSKVVPLKRKWLWAAAAACLLFLLGGSFLGYYFTNPNEGDIGCAINTAQTGPGQFAKVTFHDGSTVVLAANTSITFKEQEMKRPVVYLDGEAYFNLKNAGAGYIIKTNDLITITKNAKLNISAFPEDSTVRIMIESGKASIKKSAAFIPWTKINLKAHKVDSGKQDKIVASKTQPAMLIQSNEQLIFDKTDGLASITPLDPNSVAFLKLYPANSVNKPDSLSGVIRFSNSDVHEITRKLNVLFHLNFVLDEGVENLPAFTRNFHAQENPFNILIVAGNQLGFTYRMEGSTVRIILKPGK